MRTKMNDVLHSVNFCEPRMGRLGQVRAEQLGAPAESLELAVERVAARGAISRL